MLVEHLACANCSGRECANCQGRDLGPIVAAMRNWGLKYPR